METKDGLKRALNQEAEAGVLKLLKQLHRLAEGDLNAGDGATWIWSLVDKHLPETVQIVDLWKVARAIFGPNMPQASAWAEHCAGGTRSNRAGVQGEDHAPLLLVCALSQGGRCG